jgi:hypothetical protein
MRPAKRPRATDRHLAGFAGRKTNHSPVLFMFGGAASDLHHGGSDFDGHPLVLQKLPRQFGMKLRQRENGFPLVSECRRRIFREWRQLSDAIAALSTNALKQSSWYRTPVTHPVKSAGPR